MRPPPTLILTRSDVSAILTLRDCIAAVEGAFRRHAEGQTLPPGVLGVPATGGGFHIKAAGLRGAPGHFAAKTNANFPENPRRFGLPTIQGTIVLCDAAHGAPLAVMDSALVTALRTAAATAVAAKWLARPDSRSAAIVGCGAQGAMQLAALVEVLPIERAWAVDLDAARAEAFASHARSTHGFDVEVVKDTRTALLESDVCVTCTTSRQALVWPEDVRAGTFIAAVGADSEGKQELDPRLLAASTLVVDVLEQCARIGELQHALAAGLMQPADVHAELADVVVGRRPGRTRPDEITIFDSSGTALQDVAAAVVVEEKARAAGRGIEVRFDD